MRFFVLVLVLILPLSLRAEVPVAEVPGWVEELPIPDLPAELYAHATNGVAYRLVDRQYLLEGTRRLDYSRLVIEVTGRAGLDFAGTYSEIYDPARERLSMVRIDRIRNGQRLSLAGQLEPTLVRREDQLEAGILDGRITAVYHVPGLQVGDLLDTVTLLDTGEYLPGQAEEIWQQMEFAVPVGLTRLLVHDGDGTGLRHAGGAALFLGERSGPQGRRLEWRAEPSVPQPEEMQLPPDVQPYDAVTLTPHASWDAATAALVPHYTRPYPVPEAWAARVEAIRASASSPVRRAHAALRLVQDEIRYVGIEVGIGGFVARPPERVVALGYGDCKDKALLLKTLLRALDIEAEVALASFSRGFMLDRELPRSTAFDHMIVAARIDGGWLFLDPTREYEGGTGTTALEPALGWVLPVTAGPDELVRIPDSRTPRWQVRIEERFRFAADGIGLRVSTEMRGESANDLRQRWDRQGALEIGDNYLAYYDGLYPGIRQLQPPTLKDDRAGNRILVREHYLIPLEALSADGWALWHDFTLGAEYAFGPYADQRRRTRPLAIPHPQRFVHRVEVSGAAVDFEPPEAVSIRNPAFEARFWAGARGKGSLTMTWSYASAADRVAPSDLGRVLRDVDRAMANRRWSWDLGEPPSNWFIDLLRALEGDGG